MKEKQTIKTLYELSKEEKQKLQKKYCPDSANQHTAPPTETQYFPQTAPPKKSFKNIAILASMVLIGIMIGIVAVSVINNAASPVKTSPSKEESDVSNNQTKNKAVSEFKNSEVVKNSEAVKTEVSKQNSNNESSTKSSSTEIAPTYLFDEDTQTLTILSDDYFNGDYLEYSGTNNRVSNKVKHVIISQGVTKIGSASFFNCTLLADITIPDSVTEIGDNAFYYCKELKNITIPDSVTIIKDSAFEKCLNLESITISDSVTEIGYDAFYGTAWYHNQSNGPVYAGRILYKYKGDMPENTNITISDNTIMINKSAFEDYENLKSITIPDSVKEIGSFAFNACTNLTKITIPHSVSTMENQVFYDWTDKQTIYIKGRSSAPDTWDEYWNKDCNAKIVWNT